MNVFEAIPFEDIIRYWISVVVLISVLIAILYMIWWGFLIILSAGSEEKVKWAINHIRHAVLGIGVLVLVLFIAPVITRLVGLSYGEYLSPKNILSTISEISGKIFGTQSDTETLPKDTTAPVSTSFSDL